MNNDPKGIYEIVLSEDPYYRKKIDELSTALRKLNVAVYFVGSEGKITKQ